MVYDLEGKTHLKTRAMGKLLCVYIYMMCVSGFPVGSHAQVDLNGFGLTVGPVPAPRSVLLFVEHGVNSCGRDLSVGIGTDGRATPTQITDYRRSNTTEPAQLWCAVDYIP